MKSIRCEKCLKYYDAEKYEMCPHCQSAPDQAPQEPPKPSRSVRRHDWLRRKKNEQEFSAEPKKDAGEEKEIVKAAAPDDDRTVSVFEYDPVVGWLVCTGGAYKGRSFELKTGRNGIGRAANMQIRLDREYSVAAGKHAEIIYNHLEKSFALAGERDAAILLNGESLTEIKELEGFDEIVLGSAAFVFVPLCGSRFSWEKAD